MSKIIDKVVKEINEDNILFEISRAINRAGGIGLTPELDKIIKGYAGGKVGYSTAIKLIKQEYEELVSLTRDDIKILNMYRNRYYNSTDRDEVELASVIDKILLAEVKNND